MDWILEHLQVLIVIAAAVFAILQKFKIVRTPGTNAPAAEEDPEQAERTRRVQEEIRRRIMERRGQAPTPAPAEEGGERPFPEAPPMIEEVRPVVVPPPVLVPLAPVIAAVDAGEAERQRLLRERLRELEQAVAAGTVGAPAVAAAAEPVSAPAAGLVELLRRPAGLRQAVVLREILDAPPGLRPPESPGQGIWTRM